MASAKKKVELHEHNEKRADEEAAVAIHVKSAVATVCGWVEELHMELKK